MRRTLGLAAVGFAMLMLVTAASAQERQGRGRGEGGRGGPGGRGPGSMLLNENVQKELNLSEDQVKKIKEAAEKVQASHKEELDALGKADRSEGREKRQSLFRTMSQETDKQVKEILTPEQQTRYEEIRLQMRGARAFEDAEVQSKLKLTDEQKSSIKTILEDSAKEMRSIRESAGEDRQAIGQKMMALRKETMEKITGVLNDEQKKTWTKLTGKHFDFSGGRRTDQ